MTMFSSERNNCPACCTPLSLIIGISLASKLSSVPEPLELIPCDRTAENSAAISTFTNMFPTNIVLSRRCGCLKSLNTRRSSLPPWLMRLTSLLLNDIRAVSDAEKKPEKNSNINMPNRRAMM